MLFNKKQPKPDGEDGVQFEKNIRSLWIYTTLFCVFALVLIIISSVIQGKINSKADYYEGIYNEHISSSQSTIQNIQTENASLKAAIEIYKKQNEQYAKGAAEDAELAKESAELITNAEYLLLAQKEAYTGRYSDARELLKKVNAELLTEDMQSCYKSLRKMLGL